MWIADCEANNLEFGTIRQRRQHLAHHVKDFIGHFELADLTTPLASNSIAERPLAAHYGPASISPQWQN
jgi:hypothetical protein